MSRTSMSTLRYHSSLPPVQHSCLPQVHHSLLPQLSSGNESDDAEDAADVNTTGSKIRMSQSMPDILFPENLEDSEVDLPDSGI